MNPSAQGFWQPLSLHCKKGWRICAKFLFLSQQILTSVNKTITFSCASVPWSQNAQEATGGNSSIHQYPKCNINAYQTYLWGLSLGSICIQHPGRQDWIQSQEKTLWARWGPAQRTTAPEFLLHAVTDLLWHCACHLITLCLISQIVSEKKNYLPLKSECKHKKCSRVTFALKHWWNSW